MCKSRQHVSPIAKDRAAIAKKVEENQVYFELEEYFVTALVPSDTACLASSPGKIKRTLEKTNQQM